MRVSTAEELAGGVDELAAAIIDLVSAEKRILSEIGAVEAKLGEMRRRMAVGEASGDFHTVGEPLARLMVSLGARDALLATLKDAAVDLAAVRRAAR